MSAAAEDSLWAQVTSPRPLDVTDLRKRTSSCVSVLHITAEIFDDFFTEVHSRSSAQQCSPPPLCIKKGETWLCQFAHSLSLCRLLGLGPTAFRPHQQVWAFPLGKLEFSQWELHSSCEDESCTKPPRSLLPLKAQRPSVLSLLGSGAEVWAVLSWAAITTQCSARSHTRVLTILDKYHNCWATD